MAEMIDDMGFEATLKNTSSTPSKKSKCCLALFPAKHVKVKSLLPHTYCFVVQWIWHSLVTHQSDLPFTETKKFYAETNNYCSPLSKEDKLVWCMRSQPHPQNSSMSPKTLSPEG